MKNTQILLSLSNTLVKHKKRRYAYGGLINSTRRGAFLMEKIMENNEKMIMALIERIARMEAKLDTITTMIPKITEVQVALGKAEQSADSAHHRIDNIYKVAGLISTIISVVIGLLGKVI